MKLPNIKQKLMNLSKKQLCLFISGTVIFFVALVATGIALFQAGGKSKKENAPKKETPVKTQEALTPPDSTVPAIALAGDTEIVIGIGSEYAEPGFTATDDTDGDLTGLVVVTGSVDTHTLGTYVLTYRVSDSAKNTCEVTRTIHVRDLTAPAISLAGGSRMYIKIGGTYTEPGFSANDNVDGNISSKVKAENTVDTGRIGQNYIKYTVTDSSGNTSSATRSVYVYKEQANNPVVNPGDKVVYLTFDDGPSKYTARLLEILDKYNVKATFFVTHQFPQYENMIGETYRHGHTIAMHTFTHNYASVYASEDAYYNDLAQIQDVCVRQTGVIPKIVRFPGGTSNTVSRHYCNGIMRNLAESISYHGFLYCDWNVSSGDAGGSGTSKEKIESNVISGIQGKSLSVVLQHDMTQRSVEAVDYIIFWGIANGYTFLPMDETTPMVHFNPMN